MDPFRKIGINQPSRSGIQVCASVSLSVSLYVFKGTTNTFAFIFHLLRPILQNVDVSMKIVTCMYPIFDI